MNMASINIDTQLNKLVPSTLRVPN